MVLGNQTFPWPCIARKRNRVVTGSVCVCVCVCVCACVHVRGTHSLKGLEDAVEEQVPDDFAVLKGRNVPYEEIGKHCHRG